MSKLKRILFHPLTLLLAFSILFLLLNLGHPPLADWDENIYAEASRQMVVRGNYLNVYINDHPFAEKPPFFFWATSLAYSLFGIHEFSARFPSAVAGILMILLCYGVGRYIGSKRVGLLWGICYLTSLIPSFVGRSALIDHTFNMFIGASTFLLYLYDVEYRKTTQNRSGKPTRSSSWKFLTAASVCMGLGVLTKGPLGGVVPLVAFGTYKIFYRKPNIHIGHFFYCGVVSLSIALSWYLLNFLIYGGNFLEGFARFQGALFSKSLESHTGPFYYHFIVTFFGLLPWTPFLFLFRPSSVFSEQPHARPLLLVCLGWVIFVLILMSIVSTKLPQYSSSVYLPLSLFVAFSLDSYWKKKEKFPIWFCVLFVLCYFILAGVLLSLPYAAQEFARQKQIELNFHWPSTVYLWIGTFILLVLGAGFFWWKTKIKQGLVMTALGMFVFTQTVFLYHIPLYLGYAQQPMLDLVMEAHEKSRQLVFYRYVSFAALFYGKKPITMLHTYKFPGDPAILDRRSSEDVYIITQKNHNRILRKDHPLVEHVKDRGIFSVFILRKQDVEN